MALGCVALALSPSWRDEKLVLVQGTDAIRLTREGSYVAVPPSQAHATLQAMGRWNMGSVRAFASGARLSSSPLSALTDQAVLGLLGGAVKNGVLVVLCEGQGGDSETTGGAKEQRRLVRKIESQNRGGLSLAGRQYKLVADVDLAKVPDRNSYEVVGRADATQILDAVAHQPGANAEVATLVIEAQGKLTRDWRSPLSPDGLVLLRRNRAPLASSVIPEAAVTPSQIKAMLTQTEWIEIELVDDEGKPFDGLFNIGFPGADPTAGSLDADGLWARYNIEQGKYRLLVPNLNPAKPVDPPGDEPATASLVVKLVDVLGNFIEDEKYKLTLHDGSVKEGTTAATELQFEKIPVGECVFALVS